MIGIGGITLVIVLLVLSIEALRWTFRPAAKRRRSLKKIGGAR